MTINKLNIQEAQQVDHKCSKHMNNRTGQEIKNLNILVTIMVILALFK